MSRIGKKPIPIPKGVTVTVLDSANAVEVQGPKGKMRQVFPAGINFELTDGACRPGRRPTIRRSASSTVWRARWSPTP